MKNLTIQNLKDMYNALLDIYCSLKVLFLSLNVLDELRLRLDDEDWDEWALP